MVLQPPWHLPHAFERPAIGLPITETPYVFTYGLTVTELCRAESLVDARLLDRVGFPWIVDLDNHISHVGSPQLHSALTSLGIDKPGDPSSARQLVSNAEPLVLGQAVMDALAGSATHRVREFVEHELAEFGADLEQSAPGGRP